MTLFVWMDEHGKWRLTHLPPIDDSAYVRVCCLEGHVPTFITDEGEAIEEELGR